MIDYRNLRIEKKNREISFILTSTVSTANELGKNEDELNFFHIKGVNSTDIKTSLEVFPNIRIFSNVKGVNSMNGKSVEKKNGDVSFILALLTLKKNWKNFKTGFNVSAVDAIDMKKFNSSSFFFQFICH